MYNFEDVYAVYNASTDNYMEREMRFPGSNDPYRVVWRDEKYHTFRGNELEILDECFKEGHGPRLGKSEGEMAAINNFFHQRMYNLIKTALEAGEEVWLVKLVGNEHHILVPDFTSTEIMVR